MKITKYEHSLMVLEEAGEQLVIDPASLFRKQLPEVSNAAGIIITHEHQDHLDANNLQEIANNNPGVIIFAPADVIAQLDEVTATKQAVVANESCEVGPFKLQFIGGRHATIYKASPCENVGVVVNSTFYHPGDSLDLPGMPIELLALPASAPWLKTSEAMEFVKALKPKQVFPAHEGLLSEIGKMVTYNWLKTATDEAGGNWQILEPGQSIEV